MFAVKTWSKRRIFVITMEEQKLVWYATYGSNINQERFYCYIRGGQPEGAAKNYLGCSDTTLPLENEEFYIPAELYFGKSSSNWENGGVAFIRNEFGNKKQTLGRMYLISKMQFTEVVSQELNGQNVGIDFERARLGDYIFKPGSWYGKIVFLGEQHGYPIFTFTNEQNLKPTKPGLAYLKTIAIGIKECFPYSDIEIAEYFISKDGIRNKYTIGELIMMLSELN